MTSYSLEKKLQDHKKWVESGGKKGKIANLVEAVFRNTNFQNADLRKANLWRASLIGSNFEGATLRSTNLRSADLRGANLRNVNFRKAILQGANFQGADLQGANLWKANLKGTNLQNAILIAADLEGAKLHKAILYEAEFKGANLLSANFTNVKVDESFVKALQMVKVDESFFNTFPVLQKQRTHIYNNEFIVSIEDKAKCLFFTEDEKTELCEVVLSICGFNMDETVVQSYHGKNNLESIIVHTDLKKERKPLLQHIVFHVDRDIDSESDYHLKNAQDKINKRINDKVMYTLFITKYYDLEAYFINKYHIQHILFNKRISIEEADSLINEATDENIKASLTRVYKRLDIVKKEKEKKRMPFDYFAEIAILNDLYDGNKKQYRYGKKVLKTIRSLIKEKYKISINLVQKSDYINIPELKNIATSIWR